MASFNAGSYIILRGKPRGVNVFLHLDTSGGKKFENRKDKTRNLGGLQPSGISLLGFHSEDQVAYLPRVGI